MRDSRSPERELSLSENASFQPVFPDPSIPQPTLQSGAQLDYLPLILDANIDENMKTPVTLAKQLSAKFSSIIHLKREDEQPNFSFKCRGALNKISSLTREERKRGICCVSAGNHAQGVALAALKLGITATIVMPKTAAEIKVNAVKRLGANVILEGADFDLAKLECQRLCKLHNFVFIPPFDDPLIIAGQATCGVEILNQVRNLDAVFVCCGGTTRD